MQSQDIAAGAATQDGNESPPFDPDQSAAPAEAPSTSLTVLTTITEYKPIEAELIQFEGRFKDLVYPNLHTTKGLAVAIADRKAVRDARIALEDKRKEIKAPVLAQAKLIDDEAKRITGRIEACEAQVNAIVVNEQERREKAKAEEAAKEQARKSAILGQIEHIRSAIMRAVNQPVTTVQEVLAELIEIAITEAVFQEFTSQAGMVKDDAVRALTRMVDDARRAEEAAKQAKQDAEDLARLRAIEAERAKLETIEKAARLAAEVRARQEQAARDEADRKAREEEKRIADAAEAAARAEALAIEARAAAQREAELEAERAKLREQEAAIAAREAALARAEAEAQAKADREAAELAATQAALRAAQEEADRAAVQAELDAHKSAVAAVQAEAEKATAAWAQMAIPDKMLLLAIVKEFNVDQKTAATLILGMDREWLESVAAL